MTDARPCPHCGAALALSMDDYVDSAGRVKCHACGRALGVSLPSAAPLIANRWRPPSLGWRYLPWVLLLCLLLLGQHAHFNMGLYAQSPALRPYYVAACAYLPCQVPEMQDSSRLETRRLIVRPHPSAADALLLDLLLYNSAPFRQGFPGLQLEFKDLDGRVVASRRFEPGDYLAGELRGLQYIPADAEVRASLEVVNPGEAAVSYEVKLVPASPQAGR